MTGKPNTQDTDRYAVTDAICERIQDGSLTDDACTAEGITASTFRRWCAADPELDARYKRARTISADALAEQAVSVAQDRTGDAQDRRLEYDALKWLAGKRRPKEYGDKVEHEVSGSVAHLHLDALKAPKALPVVEIAPALPNVTAKLLGSTEDAQAGGDAS